ncbi:hypothetical protein O6H91_Y167100 [Diphasiastrum complanatum]|nr:hypothetical protein O6H91_Y167100 [Diphasiastrum complanatum]
MACEREYERCLCLRGLVCYLAIAVLCWRVASAPATSSGQAPGTCISQGGRFPRFIHDGKLPRKSSKGPNDLTLCRIYTKNTCCTSSQTRAAMNSLRRLASNGEANNTCLELWEVLECAICDPRVGTKPGPPVICSSFCESIFTACADAFFAMDPTSQDDRAEVHLGDAMELLPQEYPQRCTHVASPLPLSDTDRRQGARGRLASVHSQGGSTHRFGSYQAHGGARYISFRHGHIRTPDCLGSREEVASHYLVDHVR